MCARTQRTGAAAREPLRQKCLAGLTSLYACGSASPFYARYCHSSQTQVVFAPLANKYAILSSPRARTLTSWVNCWMRVFIARLSSSSLPIFSVNASTCAETTQNHLALQTSKNTLKYFPAVNRAPNNSGHTSGEHYHQVPKFSPCGSVCCASA